MNSIWIKIKPYFTGKNLLIILLAIGLVIALIYVYRDIKRTIDPNVAYREASERRIDSLLRASQASAKADAIKQFKIDSLESLNRNTTTQIIKEREYVTKVIYMLDTISPAAAKQFFSDRYSR